MFQHLTDMIKRDVYQTLRIVHRVGGKILERVNRYQARLSRGGEELLASFRPAPNRSRCVGGPLFFAVHHYPLAFGSHPDKEIFCPLTAHRVDQRIAEKLRKVRLSHPHIFAGSLFAVFPPVDV